MNNNWCLHIDNDFQWKTTYSTSINSCTSVVLAFSGCANVMNTSWDAVWWNKGMSIDFRNRAIFVPNTFFSVSRELQQKKRAKEILHHLKKKNRVFVLLNFIERASRLNILWNDTRIEIDYRWIKHICYRRGSEQKNIKRNEQKIKRNEQKRKYEKSIKNGMRIYFTY